MRASSLRLRAALAVVLLLALTFAVMGFGHRVPSARASALEAYVLSGGSLADLCGADHDGEDDHHGPQGCPVCHLTGAGLIPVPVTKAHDIERHFLARIVAPQPRRAQGRAHDPAHPPRGPPTV